MKHTNLSNSITMPVRVGSYDIYMYDANTMMDAVEIRDAIIEEIKKEVVRFVMDENNNFYSMFDRTTWHDDEGRAHTWGGKLGKCTYEKAIEVLINHKIKFFKSTHMAIHVMQEQYDIPEIHSLLLSSCYKVYVHGGRYYSLAKDAALPYIGKKHIKEFLNIDLVSAY